MKTNLEFDAGDLREKDRLHSVHGWTDYAHFVEEGPEVLVEGDGVHVTDIDFLAGTLRESIRRTQDDLVREGVWRG